MKPNKKVVTLPVALFLIFIGLDVFLLSKYQTRLYEQTRTNQAQEIKAPETKTAVAIIPHVNTFALPPARVNEKYSQSVFASLAGANEDLTISVSGLPDGLSFGQCRQEFNINLIPVPNTQTSCVIEGTPIQSGLYHLKISASTSNQDGRNTTENTLDLVVN